MHGFASRRQKNRSGFLHCAVRLRDEGRLFRRGNAEMEDLFRGSIDRFCEIAVQLSRAKRVLDVGARQGLLLSFLAELGHHYLHATPILYKGMSFYPLRHNREFTKGELELLLHSAGFQRYEVSFLKSRRFRKSLMAVAYK